MEKVSFEYIDQITLGDPQATSELLKVYITQNKQNIRDLQEALLIENWAFLRKIAHKLKSSLALVGLGASRALAEELEKTAGDNLHDTHRLVTDVCRVTQDAIDEVAKKLNSLKA